MRHTSFPSLPATASGPQLGLLPLCGLGHGQCHSSGSGCVRQRPRSCPAPSHSPTGAEGVAACSQAPQCLLNIKSSTRSTELLTWSRQHRRNYKETKCLQNLRSGGLAARRGKCHRELKHQKKLPGQGHLLCWLEVRSPR